MAKHKPGCTCNFCKRIKSNKMKPQSKRARMAIDREELSGRHYSRGFAPPRKKKLLSGSSW